LGIFTQRQGAQLSLGQVPAGTALEPGPLAKDRPEPRVPDILPFGEETVEPGGRVLQAAFLVPIAEGEFAGAQGHFQALQEPAESGIGLVVEEDEARIHRFALVRPVGDGDRVGVPAGVGVLVVEGDHIMLLEEIGGRQARRSPADDRDIGDFFAHEKAFKLSG